MSDVRLCKVRVGDYHMVDTVGYGTLTVVFPGDLTVSLWDVAYVPDIVFNLLALMIAHKQAVRCTIEEEDTWISLVDGGLKFEGDGSSYAGFACMIEADDGSVSFLLLTPNPPEDFSRTWLRLPPGVSRACPRWHRVH